MTTQAKGSKPAAPSSHSIPARSRWFVGSSSSSRSGFCTRASAIASRFLQPPENVTASVSKSEKPARPSVSRRRASHSVSGTRARFSAASMTERTVAPAGKSGILLNVGHAQFCAASLRPHRDRSRPASILSSVDLPLPFGPIRPIRSPSLTVNEISRKREVAPKAFDDRLCALSRRAQK